MDSGRICESRATVSHPSLNDRSGAWSSRRSRQRPNPYGRVGENLAPSSTETCVPLNTEVLFAGISGGELVLSSHHPVPPAQRPPQRDRTQQRNYQVGQGLERELQASCPDQER